MGWGTPVGRAVGALAAGSVYAGIDVNINRVFWLGVHRTSTYRIGTDQTREEGAPLNTDN